jgi:hypothetical protein
VAIFILARNGSAPAAEGFRPAGREITTSDATAAATFAAEELAAFLQARTGTPSAVVERKDAPIRLRIAADLPREAVRYAITTDGVRIEGGGERGLLYAVWEFCERELGVRFLTKEHTHIPEKAPDLVLEPKTHEYRSPFTHFRQSYYGEAGNPLFASRLRTYPPRIRDEKLGGPLRFRLVNHTLHNYVPVRRYGKKHPEYFALVDGERRVDVEHDWSSRGTQLCYTNPEVLAIVTEKVLAKLEKHPEWRNISISQADNRYYCRCPSCKAIHRREGTPMGALLHFVNQVAEAVEEERPDVLVGTLAYQWSRTPPRHLKPRDNVQIQLCSIEACQMHALANAGCPLNRPFAEDIRRWSELTGNLTAWVYCANFANYLLPLPNLGTLEENLRFLAEHNCIGVLMQGPWNGRGAEFSDLKNYLICRLLWNPKLDEEKLVEEFLSLHYGDAAPAVAAILKEIHAQRRPDLHRNCYGAAAHYGLDAGLGRELVLDFAAAMKGTDDPNVRRRLEKASICCWRLLADPWWPDKEWWREGAVDTPEPVDPLPPATRTVYGLGDLDPDLPVPVAGLFALCERHGVTNAAEGWSMEDAQKAVRTHLANPQDAEAAP